MSVEAVEFTDIACTSQFEIVLRYVMGTEPVDN